MQILLQARVGERYISSDERPGERILRIIERM